MNAYSETYSEYDKRINSIRYILKPDESISTVLERMGYKNLYRRGGMVDQTLWKNGLTRKQMKDLEPGTEIYLPYRKVKKKVVKKVIQKKKIIKRKIASIEPKKNEKDQPQASLAFNIGNGFLSIKSKDSSDLSGNIDTKNYVLAEVRFSQFWKFAETYFSIFSHQIILDSPETTNISKNQFAMTTMRAGLWKNLSNTFLLHTEIATDPVIFTSNNTNSLVTVKSGQIQNYSIGLGINIAKYKNLYSRLRADYSIIPSQKIAGANYKNSTGSKVSIENEFRKKNWAITGEAFYHTKNLKRDITTDNQTSFGIMLGASLTWD